VSDKVLAAQVVAGKANQTVLIALPTYNTLRFRFPKALGIYRCGIYASLPRLKFSLGECAQKSVNARLLIPEFLPAGSRVG
jgi:hypothetical protein